MYKRQKKKKRDNKTTIAANLLTMDTCGDCDDEEA
jgi:hypothetical protein